MGRRSLLLFCLCSLLAVVEVSAAQESHASNTVALAQVAVMALEPTSDQAVVRLPDDSLHLVAVGETLPETRATLLGVLADRIVVEELIEAAQAPPIRRQAWLFQAEGPEKTSRLQLLERRSPKEEPARAPSSETTPMTEKASEEQPIDDQPVDEEP